MSKPEVFIIESLEFDDEEEERFEGRILADILRLAGKKPIYYYVRTKRELVAVLDLFERSQYRYLHLSCHGDDESIATTLDDNIGFRELSEIMNPHLERRRLFVSSCDVVNDQLAETLMPSGCLSITGPTQKVGFAEAAILWASFYHLAFFRSENGWKGKDLKLILEELAPLLAMELAYYGIDSSSPLGYRNESYGRD